MKEPTKRSVWRGKSKFTFYLLTLLAFLFAASILAMPAQVLADVKTQGTGKPRIEEKVIEKWQSGSLLIKKTFEEGVPQNYRPDKIIVDVKGPKNFTVTLSEKNDWQVKIRGLRPGYYTAKERYVKNWTPVKGKITVKVYADKKKTATILFYNKINRGSLVITKKFEGKTSVHKLPEVTVNVTGPKSFSVKLSKKNNWTFKGYNLMPGEYTATEAVPAGWTADKNPLTAKVEPGKKATLRFVNKMVRGGDLLIKKSFEGKFSAYKLPDVKVTVKGEGYEKLIVLNRKNDWSYKLKDLKPGTYTLTETVPTGWMAVKNPMTASVEANKTAVVKFVNKLMPRTGDLVIKKVFEGNHDRHKLPSVYVKVEGKYFKKYILLNKYNNWTVKLQGLKPGEYVATETVPKGWMAVKNPISETVAAGKTATICFVNKVIPRKGTLIIKKEFIGERDKPAEVKVIVNKGEKTFEVTLKKSEGYETTLTLEPGTYTATEVVPKGWEAVKNPITETVVAGKTATICFVNKALPKNGTLIIKKEFIGERDKPDEVKVTVNKGEKTFEVTLKKSEGYETTLTLEPGTYTATEVVPKGWEAVKNPITENVVAGKTATICFVNKALPKTGTLIIKKEFIGERDKPAEVKVTVKKGEKTFEVTLKESEDYEISLSLEPGTYTATEMVPEGWEAEKNPITETVVAGETKTICFVNKAIPKTGTLIIKKVYKGATSQDVLAPVTVKVTGPDFSEQATLTADTWTKTFENLKPGNYTVTEINLPEGWYTDDESTTEAVKAGETTTITIVNKKLECKYYDATAWGYNSELNIPFSELGLSNWGWSIGPMAEGSHYEVVLLADQNVEVGKADVYYNGSVVTVKVEMYEGNAVTNLHIWAGATPLPKVGDDYTAAPGQIHNAVGAIDAGGGSATYEVLDVQKDANGEVYVAIHADVTYRVCVRPE